METKENIISENLIPLETSPLVAINDLDNKLVTNEKLASTLDKALNNSQDDRQEISGILEKFLDMVLNEGDATSASKEAVVNLVKAKSEVNDQIIKILELMSRIKLKERMIDPAMNRAIHAQQNNIYLNKAEDETNILLQEIEKASSRVKNRR